MTTDATVPELLTQLRDTIEAVKVLRKRIYQSDVSSTDAKDLAGQLHAKVEVLTDLQRQLQVVPNKTDDQKEAIKRMIRQHAIQPLDRD